MKTALLWLVKKKVFSAALTLLVWFVRIIGPGWLAFSMVIHADEAQQREVLAIMNGGDQHSVTLAFFVLIGVSMGACLNLCMNTVEWLSDWTDERSRRRKEKRAALEGAAAHGGI